MFDNRKDPMIDTVQKVMDENALRRQIEADLNEELGIQDRKQLGHEKHDLYDQALSQRINEAVLSPKQKSLAAIGGNPKKIDAPDLAKLRAMKNEAKDVEANEEPPFEPDVKKSTPWKNPQSKAKNMAREMMKKMKAKQDIKEEEQTDKTGKNKKASHDWASDPRVAKAIKYQINQSGKQREKELKEEEQIDEERKRTSAVSSAFLAGKPAKQKELQTNGQEMTYHGNVIAKHAGDEVHVTTAGYGHSPSTRGHINGVLNRLGAPGLSQKKGKLMHGDTEVGTRDWIKIKKPTATMSEEQIDELSKKTLGSYIKKASTDVHNKGYQAGNAAPKYGYGDDKFKKPIFKSIKRQVGISKATDKLVKKDQDLQELSKETLGSYIKKASHDAATKSAATGRYAERATKVKDETKKGDYSNYQQGKKDDATADNMFGKSWKRRKGIAKAVDKLTNEDLSLESIQEEIRNNLLERANRLLENGSQEQIVEFMNDLTMEQRSILNTPLKETSFFDWFKNPGNVPASHPDDKPTGSTTPTAGEAAKPATNLNITTAAPTPPAAAPVRAAPTPAAAPRPTPSSVSTADTGGDKYGSGNASAGFERGKYAAPSSSDNSSGANELRSKQQAVDRGNLEESKTKYIPESITFERFLRNR